MAVVHNPDGSITVGIIPEPKEEAKEPATVKRGGKAVKEK
jgi:hypothetical protein